MNDQRNFKAAVITVSDKGSSGLREDTGGPLVAGMLEDAEYVIAVTAIVPDEQKVIEKKLLECANMVDLIVTTGGTGFSVRDVTPEATIAVCHRLVPGIPEAMRSEGLKITPRAMLSRAAAGICGRTLIINLPGSPKAARENLNVVLPSLNHSLEILTGGSMDCAEKLSE